MLIHGQYAHFIAQDLVFDGLEGGNTKFRVSANVSRYIVKKLPKADRWLGKENSQFIFYKTGNLIPIGSYN